MPRLCRVQMKKKLKTFTTRRLTQSFANKYDIESRALTGKYEKSLAKTVSLMNLVAYHLLVHSSGFKSGELLEDDLQNENETHFVIEVGNGRDLGFSG